MRYVSVFSVLVLCCAAIQAEDKQPKASQRLIPNLPTEMLAKTNVSLPDFTPPWCNIYGVFDITLCATFSSHEQLKKVQSQGFTSTADLYVYDIDYVSEGEFPYPQLKFIWITDSDDSVQYKRLSLNGTYNFSLAVRDGKYTVTRILPVRRLPKKFKSVDEAILELTTLREKRRPDDALAYLYKHPELFPQLTKMVESQEAGWQFVVGVLVKAKYKPAVPIFIKRLEQYCADEKAINLAFCTQMPLGSSLSYALGEMGDKAAIPALKEAITAFKDPYELQNAYVALYKLNAISFDDIVKAVKANPQLVHAITKIAWDKMNSDPQGAIEIYNRVIWEFPNDKNSAVSAHWGKMRCYENLKQYRKAIQECDEILQLPESQEGIIEIRKNRSRLEELAK